jgi:hypothetical protein
LQLTGAMATQLPDSGETGKRGKASGSCQWGHRGNPGIRGKLAELDTKNPFAKDRGQWFSGARLFFD